MEYKFNWVSNATHENKISTEAKIREDQESGHSPITFCHHGIVAVTLSSPDPLQMMLVGQMKCSCGKLEEQSVVVEMPQELFFKLLKGRATWLLVFTTLSLAGPNSKVARKN